MEEFKEQVKKLTISFTKDNSKMIFIMVMVDTFIQMEISIQEIGLMENGQAGVNRQINLVKLMKVCGNTVNLWDLDEKINIFKIGINYQDSFLAT